MKTYTKDICGKPFIVSELIPVYQKKQKFFITKMPAKFLLDTYVVEPVEYDVSKESVLANSLPDYAEYFQSRIDMNKERLRNRKFERKEDKNRIREIAEEFLNKEEYAFFPNTIIVTCDLLNDAIDYDPSESIDSLVSKNLVNLPLLVNNDGELVTLYIPYSKKQILIIDGQHRLRGIEEASEKVKSNYEMLVSFLIGFDRATIAQQFYTINYTQKSVNKSLLYHLRGEFSYELNEITFMHETVRILNEIDKSPFFKRIKMLGTIDENTPIEERKYLTISQAFLIDYLKNTIDKDVKTSIHPPIFLYYYKQNETIQIEIIRFIIKYFNAIKSLLPEYWNNPEGNVLCKTVSIGAFIRVMYYVYIYLFVNEFKKNPDKIKDIKMEDIKEKLRGVEKIDFSSEGNYGKTASGGTLNKLREEIVEKITLFNNKPFDVFMSEYRSSYLKPFQEWVNNI